MRLIDADAFEVITYMGREGTFDNGVQWLAEQIDAQPTVEERKTGKWIKNSNGTYSCDKCHSWIPNEQHYYANFCLYCGAVMIGEEP